MGQRSLKQKVSQHPRLYVLLGVGIIIVGILVTAMILPRTLQFNYASKACVGQVTLLPSLHTANVQGFSVSHDSLLKVGSFPVAAAKLCVTATDAPKEGVAHFRSSLFGSFIIGKTIQVTVPAPPKVDMAVLETDVPSMKPVKLALNGTDELHTYTLKANQSSVECKPAQQELTCDVRTLRLPQGKTVAYELQRSFKGDDKTALASGEFRTLSATKIVSASVTKDQTIYDKVTTISFVTDKPLKSAQVALKQGDTSIKDMTQKIEGNKVDIALKAELAREKPYTLSVSEIEAADGSGLAEPYNMPFKTSGGPAVKAVSVSATNVEVNARVTVTFDQPITDSIDVSKFAQLTGATSTIRKEGDKVIFQLQNAPLCSALKFTIKKGMTGQKNGVASTKDWSHDSRVVCGRQATIGYSVKGRPIVAYYYGSGSTSILYTGGMHGSEQSGYATMQAWVNHLSTNAYQIPAGRQIVVVPNTNPDGISAGTRYNSRGVNIDRNFPTRNWQSSFQTANGMATGAGGSKAASEPETQALMALTSQLRPRLEVSFHSRGSLVGANKYGMSRSAGSTYASMVGYGTMYDNAEEVMGYPMTGEYEDWIGEAFGLPAILIELPGHSGSYFNAHQAALWRTVSL